MYSRRLGQLVILLILALAHQGRADLLHRYSQLHVVCVMDPPNNRAVLYLDGVRAGINTSFDIPLSAVNNVFTYREEYKAELNDPTWTVLTPSVMAGGSTQTVTDTIPDPAQRFYRVALLP